MITNHSTIPDSLIEDWFKIGKAVQQVEIKTHTSQQRHRQQNLADDDGDSFCARIQEADQTSYSTKYKEEEEREALNGLSESCRPAVFAEDGNLDELEELTVTSSCLPNTNDLLIEATAKVYDTYDFENQLERSIDLPISAYKEHIVHQIESSRVTVIQGSTGSGKTTQVPQYILEKCAEEKIHCNIVVTQPRRIAAMSIARRVCAERGWNLGGIVGYQVGLDNQTSEDTRLTYVTTGVLLQKLISTRNMNDYTHVILDEIHERDIDSDLLMLVVRKLSRTVSRDTRVVLMSATLDVDLYAEYFSMPCGDRMQPAQQVSVAGQCFDVYEYTLENIETLGILPPYDMSDPRINPLAYPLAVKLIDSFDGIDSAETTGRTTSERGSVLVFLPGIEEINEMYRCLDAEKTKLKLYIVPLHSSISWEDQNKAFKPASAGYRKVIISTNIAESSITVPDVKYVIDFCLTKALVSDPGSNYSFLSLEWASRSNCIQRKGRAGRVAHGRVYRMVHKALFDGLPEFGIPEMKRCPLDKAVLHAKILDMGEPKAILGLSLDPPDLTDIERTILLLLEIGALAKCKERYQNVYDGDLTYLGRMIAKLPIDVYLGKLIVLGHVFGCLNECIVIAAGLSQKSIFSRPFNDPLAAYQAKFEWARGSFSDCVALYNVYKLWQMHKKTRFFERPGGLSEKQWGLRKFVQIRRLYEMKNLVIELQRRLERVNIRVPHNDEETPMDAERCLLLKIVIAGAFYPHYFTQSQLDEVLIAKEVCGNDPNTTVVLSGLPAGHGLLYTNAIEEMLSPCGSSSMTFSFENTKAYVNFNSVNKSSSSHKENSQAGLNIPDEMYSAIKMRLARIPLQLRLLHPAEASKQLEQLGMSSHHGEGIVVTPDEFRTERPHELDDDVMFSSRKDVKIKQLRTHRISTVSHSNIEQVELPGLHESVIALDVTEVIDCANFWAQYTGYDDVEKIKTLIAKHMIDYDEPVSGPLTPGKLCLAKYQDIALEYYRARIESISAGQKFEIFYVDYGNSALVKKDDLRAINEIEFPDLIQLPMQAVRCSLAGIKPCPSKCPAGVWTRDAFDFVMSKIDQQSVHGRVYSVVHGVIRIDLIYKDKKNMEHSLNQNLQDRQFAVADEEDYLSKQNNAIRCKAQKDLKIEELEKPKGLHLSQLLNVNDLSLLTKGGRKITLHGPYSPLEVAFSALARGSFFSVHVEQDSVNSVALDYDPKDTHARLMVASGITMSSSGNQIVARGTTLFPNIHGLLALVVIMFSPRVEFRTDRERTRYTGALCGLGCQRNGYPIFAEHDMEIIFDTLLKQEDIILINQVRIGINMMLGSQDEVSDIDLKHVYKIQSKLKSQIFKLINNTRESVTPKTFAYPGRWQMVNETHLLQPTLDNTEANVMHVLPLLAGIALKDVPAVPNALSLRKVEELSRNIRDLHFIANQKKSNFAVVVCDLCNITLNTRPILLAHLASAAHKALELQLFLQLDKK